MDNWFQDNEDDDIRTYICPEHPEYRVINVTGLLWHLVKDDKSIATADNLFDMFDTAHEYFLKDNQ